MQKKHTVSEADVHSSMSCRLYD